MLELEVNPCWSLGTKKWSFLLGMHFSQAVAILQQHAPNIRGIHIIYNQAAPLESDLVLYLSQDGIKLVFDSLSQRLKLIHVVNMKLVKLTYGNRVFNCPETPPTRIRIDEVFGATHPEHFDDEKQEFVLTFPGLAFYFPPEAKSGASNQQVPVSSLQIYAGKTLSAARVPSPPNWPGHIQLDSIAVLRESNKTIGIKAALVAHCSNGQLQSMPLTVLFGDSCQTVMSALGSPNRVFYKSEDKMKIHNVKRQKNVTHSDYFFNYFTYGLDVLFDAKSHQVKKFVLHTNFPGHHNFNMYQRCNFELPLDLKKSISPREAAQLIDLPEVVTVGPSSKWDVIGPRLATRGPPVVLRKSCSSTGSTGGNTAPVSSVQNTHCYNYQDIIIEVMSNNHIAAVTLFKSPEEAA